MTLKSHCSAGYKGPFRVWKAVLNKIRMFCTSQCYTCGKKIGHTHHTYPDRSNTQPFGKLSPCQALHSRNIEDRTLILHKLRTESVSPVLCSGGQMTRGPEPLPPNLWTPSTQPVPIPKPLRNIPMPSSQPLWRDSYKTPCPDYLGADRAPTSKDLDPACWDTHPFFESTWDLEVCQLNHYSTDLQKRLERGHWEDTRRDSETFFLEEHTN